MPDPERPKVLWLGRPVRYQHELYKQFSAAFEVVYKKEGTRQEFLDALHAKAYDGIRAM